MTLENLEQDLAQEELLLLDLDWSSRVEVAQAKVVRLSKLVTRGNQEIEELRHQAAQLHLEFVSERDVVAQMERDVRSERSREEEYRSNNARMREELRSEWDSVAQVKENITAAHGLLEELKLSVMRTKQQLQIEEIIHARMEEHAQEQSASEAACRAREATAKEELHAEQAKVRRMEDMLKADTEEGEIAKLQDDLHRLQAEIDDVHAHVEQLEYQENEMARAAHNGEAQGGPGDMDIEVAMLEEQLRQGRTEEEMLLNQTANLTKALAGKQSVRLRIEAALHEARDEESQLKRQLEEERVRMDTVSQLLEEARISDPPTWTLDELRTKTAEVRKELDAERTSSLQLERELQSRQ